MSAVSANTAALSGRGPSMPLVPSLVSTVGRRARRMAGHGGASTPARLWQMDASIGKRRHVPLERPAAKVPPGPAARVPPDVITHCSVRASVAVYAPVKALAGTDRVSGTVV